MDPPHGSNRRFEPYKCKVCTGTVKREEDVGKHTPAHCAVVLRGKRTKAESGGDAEAVSRYETLLVALVGRDAGGVRAQGSTEGGGSDVGQTDSLALEAPASTPRVVRSNGMAVRLDLGSVLSSIRDDRQCPLCDHAFTPSQMDGGYWTSHATECVMVHLSREVSRLQTQVAPFRGDGGGFGVSEPGPSALARPLALDSGSNAAGGAGVASSGASAGSVSFVEAQVVKVNGADLARSAQELVAVGDVLSAAAMAAADVSVVDGVIRKHRVFLVEVLGLPPSVDQEQFRRCLRSSWGEVVTQARITQRLAGHLLAAAPHVPSAGLDRDRVVGGGVVAKKVVMDVFAGGGDKLLTLSQNGKEAYCPIGAKGVTVAYPVNGVPSQAHVFAAWMGGVLDMRALVCKAAREAWFDSWIWEPGFIGRPKVEEALLTGSFDSVFDFLGNSLLTGGGGYAGATDADFVAAVSRHASILIQAFGEGCQLAKELQVIVEDGWIRQAVDKALRMVPAVLGTDGVLMRQWAGATCALWYKEVYDLWKEAARRPLLQAFERARLARKPQVEGEVTAAVALDAYVSVPSIYDFIARQPVVPPALSQLPPHLRLALTSGSGAGRGVAIGRGRGSGSGGPAVTARAPGGAAAAVASASSVALAVGDKAPGWLMDALGDKTGSMGDWSRRYSASRLLISGKHVCFSTLRGGVGSCRDSACQYVHVCVVNGVLSEASVASGGNQKQ